MKADHENKDLEPGDEGCSCAPCPGRKVPRFDWAETDLSDEEEIQVEQFKKIKFFEHRAKLNQPEQAEDLMAELDAKMEAGEEFYLGGTVLNPKYLSLHSELMDSYRQAAEGKGKVRHANDEPFEAQKILTIQRWLGYTPIGGLLFQAVKKAVEASRLEPEAAIAELSGATVYLQAAKIRLRELLKEAKGGGDDG